MLLKFDCHQPIQLLTSVDALFNLSHDNLALCTENEIKL